MIGSTDDHTSLATAEEDNFFGKFANSEPGIRTPDSRMAGLNADWELGASGLAAVWAPQNTREDLFASMKRREVYATTGSRIVMRFFGGWDYAPNSVHSPYFETIGYRDGVPMGGELSPQGEGRADLHGAGHERPGRGQSGSGTDHQGLDRRAGPDPRENLLRGALG